jgi:peptidoglycan hydrolase CwlO-like protein
MQTCEQCGNEKAFPEMCLECHYKEEHEEQLAEAHRTVLELQDRIRELEDEVDDLQNQVDELNGREQRTRKLMRDAKMLSEQLDTMITEQWMETSNE